MVVVVVEDLLFVVVDSDAPATRFPPCSALICKRFASKSNLVASSHIPGGTWPRRAEFFIYVIKI